MVEVFLATPNRISNRLFIPYVAGAQAKATADAAAAKDPAGTKKTTTNGTVTIDLTKKEFPPAPADPATATPDATATPPPARPSAAPKGVSGTAKPTGFDPATSGAPAAPAAPGTKPPTASLNGRPGGPTGRDFRPGS